MFDLLHRHWWQNLQQTQRDQQQQVLYWSVCGYSTGKLLNEPINAFCIACSILTLMLNSHSVSIKCYIFCQDKDLNLLYPYLNLFFFLVLESRGIVLLFWVTINVNGFWFAVFYRSLNYTEKVYNCLSFCSFFLSYLFPLGRSNYKNIHINIINIEGKAYSWHRKMSNVIWQKKFNIFKWSLVHHHTEYINKTTT